MESDSNSHENGSGVENAGISYCNSETSVSNCNDSGSDSESSVDVAQARGWIEVDMSRSCTTPFPDQGLIVNEF
jgi:hypothetical protein